MARMVPTSTRQRRRRTLQGIPTPYSHSIVPGGFDVMS